MNARSGKDIVSSQFQFDPGDLAYIADPLHPARPPADRDRVGGRVLCLARHALQRRPALRLGPAQGRRDAERRSRAGLYPGQSRRQPRLRSRRPEGAHRAVRRDQPVRREIRDPRRHPASASARRNGVRGAASSSACRRHCEWRAGGGAPSPAYRSQAAMARRIGPFHLRRLERAAEEHNQDRPSARPALCRARVFSRRLQASSSRTNFAIRH